MILNDHIQPLRITILCQSSQTIGSETHLFVIASGTGRIHSNRMTSQKTGGIDPPMVILDGSAAGRIVRVAQSSFAITHDEETFDSVVFTPLAKILEVGIVSGLVLEETVDVLHRIEAKLFPGDPGKIEIRHLALAKSSGQRPLRQRALECLRGLRYWNQLIAPHTQSTATR